MNTVYIFTMMGCGHCSDLKDTLKDLEIPFVDYDISVQKEVWEQVVNQTKQNSVPSIFISVNNGENGPVYIPGRDFNSKEECIEIIKKFI